MQRSKETGRGEVGGGGGGGEKGWGKQEVEEKWGGRSRRWRRRGARAVAYKALPASSAVLFSRMITESMSEYV